jgi:hypothetical protein
MKAAAAFPADPLMMMIKIILSQKWFNLFDPQPRSKSTIAFVKSDIASRDQATPKLYMARFDSASNGATEK